MGFDYSRRLERAKTLAADSTLDAMLVAPGPDLLYLAGYDPPPLERLTALVVRPGSDPVLVVPVLERPRALTSPVAGNLDIVAWRDGEDPYGAVGRLLGGGGRIGVSDRLWASHLIGLQSAATGAEFVPASSALSGLRARKEPGEIDLLGRAARAADEAFDRITRAAFERRAERDVADSLAELLREAGHESVSFTIVATGPNGASPHHEPGERVIRTGDPVVMDFGGRVRGYCSDITRTVAVGPPPSELRDVYDIVREAQEAAFRAVEPGIPAEEVDRAARAVIESGGYGDAFIHRTGHGIGLEEHEDPYIVTGNRTELTVGHCFSLEPGIYLDGRFGVRIEDIVAITDDGVVRLNQARHELVEVR
ncbi:MAG: M24 family metallopeptidase [Actinomycetota bacterium]